MLVLGSPFRGDSSRKPSLLVIWGYSDWTWDAPWGVWSAYNGMWEWHKRVSLLSDDSVRPHGELEGHSDPVSSIPLSRTGTMKGLHNLLLSFDCSCWCQLVLLFAPRLLSFTQQTFIEHLLSTRPSSRRLGHSAEQSKQRCLPRRASVLLPGSCWLVYDLCVSCFCDLMALDVCPWFLPTATVLYVSHSAFQESDLYLGLDCFWLCRNFAPGHPTDNPWMAVLGAMIQGWTRWKVLPS